MAVGARKQRKDSMNIKIIYSENHPLASKLSGIIYQDNFDFSLLEKSDLVIDLTLLEDEKKLNWLTKLCDQYPVISDTTCNWGEYLLDALPNLKGALATAFYSPQNKTEVYLRDNQYKSEIDSFLNSLGLEAYYVTSAGHGFTYPRTLSTLVNEAFFALEDQLATREDMDLAMSFGVNYPHGLFQWCELIGVRPILMLLQSLHLQTGDPRYRQAPLLKRELLK